MSSELSSDCFLIETALEVANPIGGICTVIKTKAPSLLKHVKKSSFLMLGVHMNTSKEYVEKSLNEVPFIKRVVEDFEYLYDVKCIFAEWEVDSNRDLCPNVILFDNYNTSKAKEELDKAMYFLGTSYGIHFPYSSPSMDYFKYNALLLGTLVSLFVRCLLKHIDEEKESTENQGLSHIKSVILQSHEWCGSVGQLLLQRDKGSIPGGNLFKTVFTTHATIMGRFLSADNQNITAMISNNTFSSEDALFSEARRRLIELEFGVEWAAAHTTDIFTTVSDTTADEATSFLKRRPDAVTYNGSKKPIIKIEQDSSDSTKNKVNSNCISGGMGSDESNKINDISQKQNDSTDMNSEIEKDIDGCSNDPNSDPQIKVDLVADSKSEPEFGSSKEIKKTINNKNEKKLKNREKLNSFMRRHFFGTSLETIDFNKTIYFMCCGRNEFSNKGIDMFIESLAKLNTRLKTLQEKFSRRLDVTVIGLLITPSLLAFPPIVPGGHFEYVKAKEEEALSNPKGEHEVQKVDMNLKRTENPPLCAGCVDGGKEVIIQKCLSANLANHPLDPVKFIWIPKFMPFGDILQMSIDDIYDSVDCGVFPSKYEPWGYTPIECLEHGIPAITTNLAGCGCFYERIKNEKLDKSNPLARSNMVQADTWRCCSDGLIVIDRLHSNYEEAATRIADSLYDYISLDAEEVESLSVRCAEGSDLCNWDRLVMNYISCYCSLDKSIEQANKK